MILIPQIYLKNGKVAGIEGSTSDLLSDDPIQTARAMKDAGAEAIYLIDLAVPPIGASAHLPIIKQMLTDLGLGVYVGGGFKTPQAVEAYVGAGVNLVVLGPIAYQQPAFLDDVCKKFPNKIATHIDVKGTSVTIPGYAVVTNKTAFDYAERFLESGVRYIFYSDVSANGTLKSENIDHLKEFCQKVTSRIICTTEVSNLSDIEKIITLSAPRLEGLVLAKSLYEDRVNLRGAIAMANDLLLASGDEATLPEI